MNLGGGRQFLAIPGPTTVPDQVLQAMHRPAVDIYGGELPGVTDRCLEILPGLFRTQGRAYMYVGNGHAVWEAALSNTLSRGDRVLVLASGRFAPRWGETASSLGLQVEVLDAGWRAAVDLTRFEERLDADIKAVLVVHIDTATGVINDLPAIRAVMDRKGSGALFMVDAVASLGTAEFAMDAWGIDVAVAASQKGLMLPPGMGFVAAGPGARAAHGSADLRTRYWDWTFRDGSVHYQKYCGTPPVHLLFGLEKALGMILEEGLDHVVARHRALADAVHSAVDEWTKGGALAFNIEDPAHRAPSVTTILVGGGHDPEEIRRVCREQADLVLGSGFPEMARPAFRIAHMGHVNAPMILGTLAVTEAALRALGIPCGDSGVARATETVAGHLRGEA